MTRIKDLTGNVYGRLTVTGMARVNRVTYCDCNCECGKSKRINASSLKRGLTRSCGCFNSEQLSINKRSHGLTLNSNTNLMRWYNIKKRCYNKNCKSYKDYGERGIGIHHSWMDSPERFVWYLDTVLGKCPEGYSLDRIDNNGDYEPRNLRWASRSTQNKNQRKGRNRLTQ